jgi:hypothetical protein
MDLTIPMWRSKYRGGYYYHVPTAPVQWSGDIGTAAREALKLVAALHPNPGVVAFRITSGL